MKVSHCISILIVLMLFFTAGDALAGAFYNGNELVECMREWEKAMANDREVNWAKAHQYAGYVTGVCDVVGDLFEFKTSMTRGQILVIVSKYLKNHPEELHKSGAGLVIRALKEAFPQK